jgi:hypothetical protein
VVIPPNLTLDGREARPDRPSDFLRTSLFWRHHSSSTAMISGRFLRHPDLWTTMIYTYEHTAVIVAEDVTSRFLNVISLFNGFIPATTGFPPIHTSAERAWL